MSYLLRGGMIIDPASGRSAVGDLLIVGDRIAEIGRSLPPGDAEIVDAHGLIVCPGLIDMHVHLREPGFEDKETIATGTAAAAAGGFATVCAEPNTEPPVDSPEQLAEARARIAASAVVNVYPKACMTVGQAGREVSDAKALKAAGAIALSDDGEPVLDGEVMRECLRRAAKARIPVTTHCEESPRSRRAKGWAEPYTAEADLVRRDLGLALGVIPSAREESPTGHAATIGDSSVAMLPQNDRPPARARLHFSHISLAESLAAIDDARARGLKVTAEATPHHCLLSADHATKGDAVFKVNPPLRSPHDAMAVAAAVALSQIDVIASDHAPHGAAEKARPWDEAPFGVIGLETTLAVMLTGLVHSFCTPIMDLLAKMTINPARILGLKSGRLKVGAPADVTLIDLDREWTIDPRDFKSKARNCPFAGWRVKGRAVGLFVGGRMVMKDGEILAGPAAVSQSPGSAAGGGARTRSAGRSARRTDEQ